jgi:hypothetical protein
VDSSSRKLEDRSKHRQSSRWGGGLRVVNGANLKSTDGQSEQCSEVLGKLVADVPFAKPRILLLCETEAYDILRTGEH